MRDEDLDLALEQTFPASDPPSFMAGAAIAGSPHRRSEERQRALERVPERQLAQRQRPNK